jgi:Spy/CpxP family protein refolding chaperone
MKRYLRLSLTGLAATAALVAVPLTVTAANAQGHPLLAELDLTEEQQEQVQEIFQSLRNDMDDILTDEQQEQFRAVYQERQDVRSAIAEIDSLTDDQKATIRSAVERSRDDIGEVLTDEQREELRANRQERRQNRRR